MIVGSGHSKIARKSVAGPFQEYIHRYYLTVLQIVFIFLGTLILKQVPDVASSRFVTIEVQFFVLSLIAGCLGFANAL